MNPKNVIPTEIVFSTNFGIQVLPSKLNINEFIYLHIQSQILNYKCTGKVGPNRLAALQCLFFDRNKQFLQLVDQILNLKHLKLIKQLNEATKIDLF